MVDWETIIKRIVRVGARTAGGVANRLQAGTHPSVVMMMPPMMVVAPIMVAPMIMTPMIITPMMLEDVMVAAIVVVMATMIRVLDRLHQAGLRLNARGC
jgi:hypothetical protein